MKWISERIANFIAAIVVAALSNYFNRLETIGRQILTGQDHLKAAIDNLTTKSMEELNGIKSDVEALKAKQQAGTLTDADLDALATRVDGVASAIDTLKTAADTAASGEAQTASSSGQ